MVNITVFCSIATHTSSYNYEKKKILENQNPETPSIQAFLDFLYNS
jgi:hypothetical protein